MRGIKNLFFNAILLCGVSLLMRTVGVAFNAYISNKIGEVGMGLYSLVMSVYGFAVTFACSGVNLASTRLTAESEATGKSPASVMRACVLYSLAFGIAAFLFVYFASGFIASKLLCDERTVLSLKLLSVCLPFISLSSGLNGYFTAVGRAYKSASAQLFEQFAKIFIISAALSFFLPRGLEYICAAMVGGAAVSELLSFLYNYIMYIFDVKKHRKVNRAASPLKEIFPQLLGISLPVAFTSYVRSGLVTVEHMLIPRGLIKRGGDSEKALGSYGTLHGMVMPVVLFPSALMSSFAGLIVPELAESRAAGDEKRCDRIISSVFKMAVIFSLGCAGAMMASSRELGIAVYNSTEASGYIRLMAPLIPVMYTDMVVDGVLKGMGEQMYSMRVNIADAFLSVVFVWILVPIFGINGYVAAIFASEILNTALSILRLYSISDFKARPFKTVVMPTLCIVGAAISTDLLISSFGMLFGSAAAEAAFKIVVIVLFYIIFLLMTGSIDGNDLARLKAILPTRKKSAVIGR